jgi:dienelactone hydrolase
VIAARPAEGLLDSTVTLSIAGLPPNAVTTVSASARDVYGAEWSSSAQFTASKSGLISLASATSTAGSYSGRDAMGLFDLMTPASSGDADQDFVAPSSGYSVTVSAGVHGTAVASATVRRTSPNGDIVRTQYRPADAHFYGELDEPRQVSGRKPAVLVFGGSEGGLSTLTTRLLAAHGYPALALAYFKEPGLPRTLSRIPLDYFATALRALRAAPHVDDRHVLVAGVSRGSEAALLLGVHYPNLVDGVIAGVPSSVANVGYPDTSSPAWTLDGKPVPTAAAADFGKPEPTDTAAIVPVERIHGPVLTVCGQDDHVWASCPYAAAITARLTTHHTPYRHTALSYPDAGHDAGSLECCFSATPASLGSTGGTIHGDQTAQRDAWAHLLTFLAAQ